MIRGAPIGAPSSMLDHARTRAARNGEPSCPTWRRVLRGSDQGQVAGQRRCFHAPTARHWNKDAWKWPVEAAVEATKLSHGSIARTGSTFSQ